MVNILNNIYLPLFHRRIDGKNSPPNRGNFEFSLGGKVIYGLLISHDAVNRVSCRPVRLWHLQKLYFVMLMVCGAEGDGVGEGWAVLGFSDLLLP